MALKLAFNPITAQFDLVQDLSEYLLIANQSPDIVSATYFGGL
jgi:hypothetical protein